jgi:tRNA pseudouridine32 synthase/23S rRNA pseudouridine746 synthase
MAQEIVDNNDSFIIVNKPHGISCHDDQGVDGLHTILTNEFGKLWQVHRLDKDTSGLMIYAKTSEAASVFGKLFSEKAINKYYLAIATGKPKKKQGSIVGDMASSRRKQYKLLRSKENPSKTHFFSYPLWEKHRLYLLKPYTGKTHQLRVVMNSLGVPIKGDTIYGGAETSRLLLHAYHLEFSFNDQKFEYSVLPPETESELNHEMVLSALNSLKNPHHLNWPKL